MKIRKGLAPYWVEIEDAKFEVSPLTSLELLECYEIVKNKGQPSYYDICQRGLTNWSGIEDDNGAAVAFSKDEIPYVPADVIAQLAGIILTDNKLSKEEQKN